MMTDTQSKTKALLQRLATTDHRRSLAADRIFRQLRKEDEAKREKPATG